jgi:hypothetical protein
VLTQAPAGLGVVPARSATPQPTSTAGADPRFATCAQARAHGYGPYAAGGLEYGWYRDADGDGTVCEG